MKQHLESHRRFQGSCCRSSVGMFSLGILSLIGGSCKREETSQRSRSSSRGGVANIIWVISFLSLILSRCNATSSTGACSSDSKDALLDFREAFSDPNEKVFSSWDSGGDDCCTWSGVTCSQEGAVTELDVEGPSDYQITRNESYSGEKPGASLAELQDLQTLTLKYLQFSSKIPSQWGSFSALVSLTVNDCDLEGSIPSSLSNIHTLTHLDLQNNNLSGSIPSNLCKLETLTYLDLSSNDLHTSSSSIPSCLNNITTFNYGNQGTGNGGEGGGGSNNGGGDGGNGGNGGNGQGGNNGGSGDNNAGAHIAASISHLIGALISFILLLLFVL
ncbi:hypothetical protein CY35_17G034000 [Sphagnum magellanicum]|nr:hypothetical protein CY35_17G034000 [Sphagnum magellanicum]